MEWHLKPRLSQWRGFFYCLPPLLRRLDGRSLSRWFALQCLARSIGACPQNRHNGARECLVVRIGSLTNPLFVLMGRSLFTGARSFFSWSAAVQQRDITLRLTITRLRPGACSMAISPRPSASLMAARVLALPMLARSAICATGRVHFPVVWASFRMTASTASASVFRRSVTSGETTTVEARNRRPHTRRMGGSLFLLVSSIASVPCLPRTSRSLRMWALALRYLGPVPSQWRGFSFMSAPCWTSSPCPLRSA
jgi:hypothetical protein